jgi:hypothetical protein
MIDEGGQSVDERLVFGFRLVTARRPSDAELAVLRQAYEDDLAKFTADPAGAMKLFQVGEKPYAAELPAAELAAMASAARLLLNLHEAITKG